jgi:hypothetical protein
MVKCHKISWIPALFIGCLFLMAPNSWAEVLKTSRDSKILECQTVLEKFSLRLQERSENRPCQAYYESLHRQTQEFLENLKSFPPPSPEKCQNYLNFVQGIIGRHNADLGAMPGHSGSQSGGRLTKSILKPVPKRELRNVRYEYAGRAKSKEEKKSIGEAEEELEELSFSPTPIRRSSKSGKHLASETKDYEPKF